MQEKVWKYEMSAEDELKLTKMIVEMQASRIEEQEATISELRTAIDEQ